ncbi:MAG: S-ribosylhomocysteine lyase [Clostridia bacterium]|nr:S-ribosylhomocysteine lyase [Clostridia bacterium]
MGRIASFDADHDKIVPGFYLSRVDGDISTYDLRTRTPNMGDYMDDLTMHSVEHLFATYVRNSEWGDRVIYFGPMGCQTGFYLLLRSHDHVGARALTLEILRRILAHDGPMFGNTAKECGNYRNLSVEAAKVEARRYLDALLGAKNPDDVSYPS